MTETSCQEKCAYHDQVGKELNELSESYYAFRDDQIARNETCDLQIRQHEKNIEERKSLHNHCKAATIPKIREEIQTNKDEICKIMNSFKSESRDNIISTKDAVFEKVRGIGMRLNYVFGVFALLTVFLSWIYSTTADLHAEVDACEKGLDASRVVAGQTQRDIQYLKEGFKEIKISQEALTTMMQEVLSKLPRDN